MASNLKQQTAWLPINVPWTAHLLLEAKPTLQDGVISITTLARGITQAVSFTEFIESSSDVCNLVLGIYFDFHFHCLRAGGGLTAKMRIASLGYSGLPHLCWQMTSIIIFSHPRPVPINSFLQDYSADYGDPERFKYVMRTRYGQSFWSGSRSQHQPSGPRSTTITCYWNHISNRQLLIPGYDCGIEDGNPRFWPFQWRARATYEEDRLLALEIELECDLGAADTEALICLKCACVLAAWIVIPQYLKSS